MQEIFKRRKQLAVLVTLAVVVVSFCATGFEPCTAACGTLHHKRAVAHLGFEGTDGLVYSEAIPFVLTGFGYGIASDPIVLPAGFPNPQLEYASAEWIDFRFYASFPGIGLVKGSLNLDQTSHVQLVARTNEGLFPAAFMNSMFIRLEPLAFPGLVYTNDEVLQLEAPAIYSAPPDSSIKTTQVGLDVFRISEAAPLGAPVEITFEEGIQSFLDPRTGLELELLSPPESRVMRFRVQNQFDVAITIAYFLYFNGDAELAARVQHLDGVAAIEPLGETEILFQICNIPGVEPRNAIVQAMILEPFNLSGADRWIGEAACSNPIEQED
jgi:hypothetical protein